MSKAELEDMLEAYGIDINDYIQATPVEAIIEALPEI